MKRELKNFDFNEKPTTKKPSPWRDPFFWIIFLLFFGAIIGLGFWLPSLLIFLLIISGVYFIIRFFAKVGAEILMWLFKF